MNINELVHLLIWLFLVGVLFYILWWGANQITMEPWRTVARVLIGLAAVVVAISLILPMLGQPPVIRFR